MTAIICKINVVKTPLYYQIQRVPLQFLHTICSVWNNRPLDRPRRITFGVGEHICTSARLDVDIFFSQVYIITKLILVTLSLSLKCKFPTVKRFKFHLIWTSLYLIHLNNQRFKRDVRQIFSDLTNLVLYSFSEVD